jgi:hypothetical protein
MFFSNNTTEAEQAWPNDLLDIAKQTGDPLGDEVLIRLIKEGNVAQVNSLLSHLDENSEGLPANLPTYVNDYFTKTTALPEWADLEKIKKAQEFFSIHGPAFGIVLMFKSLPVLYAGAKGGVQILNMTGQLKDHFRRRASETLRFILDAMEPGGLNPGGKGIRSTQKVRLMHAAIRNFALVSGKWPSDGSWGLPINQEELGGTLAAFSTEALRGLTQLGINYTRAEAECYMHAWRVIGYFLGIQEEYIPDSIESAELFWTQLETRNFARTEDALILTKVHVEFLEELIPGGIIDGIVPALMRNLLGKKIAENYLGIPSAGWAKRLVYILKLVLNIRAGFIGVSYNLDRFITKDAIFLMKSLQKYWAKTDDSVPFQIPAALDNPKTQQAGKALLSKLQRPSSS